MPTPKHAAGRALREPEVFVVADLGRPSAFLSPGPGAFDLSRAEGFVAARLRPALRAV